jgi:hypothetical protein
MTDITKEHLEKKLAEAFSPTFVEAMDTSG